MGSHARAWTPGRAALTAGLAVALVGGAIVVAASRSPDAFARAGGLRLTWAPPAGFDPRRLASRPAHAGARWTIGPQDVAIAVAGVAEADVAEAARRIVEAPFTARDAIAAPAMPQLAAVLRLPMRDAWPVDLGIDQWRPSGAAVQLTDAYLAGDRRAIADALARATAAGWSLPSGAHVAYEPREDPRGLAWRTYVVADRADLDADDVAATRAEVDPLTGRTQLAVTLTPTAAERVGAWTARVIGHKIALLAGDEVCAAPIVESSVTRGRLVVPLRGGAREAALLGATIAAGALPPGGRVEAAVYVPPEPVAWPARIAALLGGAVGVGALTFAWRRRGRTR